MIKKIKIKIYKILRWSEKYTKTDMVYLAKGGFWLTLGKIIYMTSAFLLSIAFANLLPQEIYGSYKYILSIIALLSIPALNSMETAIVQAVAQGYEGSVIPALKIKIKWAILGSIGSIAMAGYYYINDNYNLSIAFLIISIFIPLLNSLGIYGSFLLGKKEFKISTKFSIINNIISTLILFLTIYLTNNIYIILLSYFLPQIILNFTFLKIVLYKFVLNKKQNSKTIPYGIYLSLLGIITKIADNIDKILLWHFLGAIQLAIYSFAIIPVQQLSGLIKGNISTLSLPKLSESPIKNLKKTLPQKIFKIFLIIIPIIIIYIFFSPLIFKIIYPKYLESIRYSQLFSISLLFIPTLLFGNTFVAKMKKKEITIIRFISPSMRIILLLILIPTYGILGVIIARLIAGFLHICLVSFLFKQIKT